MSFAANLGITAEDNLANYHARVFASHPNQDLVRHWHRLFGYVVSDVPTVTERKTRLVRDALLFEEFEELSHELNTTVPDLSKIAHEAADLMFVLYGLAVECGFDLNAAFREVYRANMTKDRSDDPSEKATKGERFVPADTGKVIPRG